MFSFYMKVFKMVSQVQHQNFLKRKFDLSLLLLEIKWKTNKSNISLRWLKKTNSKEMIFLHPTNKKMEW